MLCWIFYLCFLLLILNYFILFIIWLFFVWKFSLNGSEFQSASIKMCIKTEILCKNLFIFFLQKFWYGNFYFTHLFFVVHDSNYSCWYGSNDSHFNYFIRPSWRLFFCLLSFSCSCVLLSYFYLNMTVWTTKCTEVSSDYSLIYSETNKLRRLLYKLSNYV